MRQRTCNVRKHRAPKGALRHNPLWGRHRNWFKGQKAPSAKRCIKTSSNPPDGGHPRVRKYRAPKGALRHGVSRAVTLFESESESTEHQTVHSDWVWPLLSRMAHVVRKHRAQKGALRRLLLSFRGVLVLFGSESTERQKVH